MPCGLWKARVKGSHHHFDDCEAWRLGAGGSRAALLGGAPKCLTHECCETLMMLRDPKQRSSVKEAFGCSSGT